MFNRQSYNKHLSDMGHKSALEENKIRTYNLRDNFPRPFRCNYSVPGTGDLKINETVFGLKELVNLKKNKKKKKSKAII